MKNCTAFLWYNDWRSLPLIVRGLGGAVSPQEPLTSYLFLGLKMACNLESFEFSFCMIIKKYKKTQYVIAPEYKMKQQNIQSTFMCKHFYMHIHMENDIFSFNNGHSILIFTPKSGLRCNKCYIYIWMQLKRATQRSKFSGKIEIFPTKILTDCSYWGC